MKTRQDWSQDRTTLTQENPEFENHEAQTPKWESMSFVTNKVSASNQKKNEKPGHE